MRALSLPLSLLLPFPLLLAVACRAEGDTKFVIDQDEDGVGIDDDCDDADPDKGEPITYYRDNDADGHGDPATGDGRCAEPAGWSLVGDDCDDAEPKAYPGAEEVCDQIDNDCDGVVDNGTESIQYWRDADGDGYGDDADTVYDCSQPEGYVAEDGDCNDGDAAYNPGATEDDCTDPNDYNCDGSSGYDDADGDGYAACAECDDGAATTNPGATEVCDDADNDCDGDTDESGAEGESTWYADVDGDGYGDASSSTAACDEPPGYTTDTTDCDDTRADRNPGATEVCNGDDDDCDTLVDDADDSLDAASTSVWYTDGDGDGYGDPASIVSACEQPAGTALFTGDCDDTDAAYNPGASETDCADPNDYNCDGSVAFEDSDGDGYGACEECDDASAASYPGATEYCDGVDNDCDSEVDESDSADASTWYADGDGDGHGDAATTEVGCSAPTGYLADGTDCDDANASVNPAQTELCNGVDDDCDGTVDDGASDGTTWYADSDGDGYGDAATMVDSCDEPAGYGEDDTDCDDTDADVHPGASESSNGVDDDCDGSIDEITWTGSGADGALTVTGTTTLEEAWAVSTITSSTVTLDGAPSLAPGDEVLVINLHGSDSAYGSVGNYEFLEVASVSGSDVTLATVPSVTFGELDNADLTDQAVQMVRVPQYTDVTVDAGGLLTALPWDGATGGILAFRATGTVSVADGGEISSSELGYAAGETGTCVDCDAFQGESYAGEGDGDEHSGSGVYANWTYGYYQNNYGGGGAMITGGGGNYGGGATNGASWTGGSYPEAEAGDAYGSADLTVLFPGSGGAGVWHGSSDPGPGGDGAGIVFIAASDLLVAGASGVTAMGGTTTHWATGSWTYGAGGGAGGSIWIIADSLTLATDSVDAGGGFGESTHIRVGGDGGYGRVRADYNSVNGQSYGGGSDATELAAAVEPDPGHTQTP